ncbi:VanZ family protein [Bacillus cereus]|uniref:VanZ family protein n=2 Tax=Bacillus cereus TaxID=1396 RepID=UPI0007AB6B87|nr:VanZ family protein [Bacillus cereus]KZD70813.1 Teicoplanin resistance protein vanZ [Bacillus cereus]MEB9901582.1 VanZ family protein [Bacillus cereus]MEC0054274.1 VanZ family protein [Bacillus cereus]MEC0215804.1 VanZ family protein [Bacillus cereus]MEC2793246.1 VanZ family protein [Bacillus cereus]
MATYFTSTFSEMIQFSPPYVSPIVGTIFLIIALILIWKYKKNEFSFKFLILRLLLVSVSFIYTMGVLIITRIEAIPWSIYERVLENKSILKFSTPQLIPFDSIIHILNIYGIGTIILGNILLLLPLGFFLPLWFRNLFNSYVVIFLIVLTSTTIEFLQYLFGVGIPNVDDVLLNTIGGGIGYGLLKLIVCFKSTYK